MGVHADNLRIMAAMIHGRRPLQFGWLASDQLMDAATEIDKLEAERDGLKQRIAELEDCLQYTERQRDEQTKNAQKCLGSALQYEQRVEELETERDRLKEALEELIIECQPPLYGLWPIPENRFTRAIKAARKAVKGDANETHD